MTFLTAGTLKMKRGDLPVTSSTWWVVLRSLLDGVPFAYHGICGLLDRKGDRLDLHTSIEADDDPEDVADFLGGGRLPPSEERVCRKRNDPAFADIDRGVPFYRPDDNRSSWPVRQSATTAQYDFSGFRNTVLQLLLCSMTTVSCGSVGSRSTAMHRAGMVIVWRPW